MKQRLVRTEQEAKIPLFVCFFANNWKLNRVSRLHCNPGQKIWRAFTPQGQTPVTPVTSFPWRTRQIPPPPPEHTRTLPVVSSAPCLLWQQWEGKGVRGGLPLACKSRANTTAPARAWWRWHHFWASRKPPNKKKKLRPICQSVLPLLANSVPSSLVRTSRAQIISHWVNMCTEPPSSRRLVKPLLLFF